MFNALKKLIKASFRKTKGDMRYVKDTSSDWILFLDARQQNLHTKMDHLEKQMREMREQQR